MDGDRFRRLIGSALPDPLAELFQLGGIDAANRELLLQMRRRHLLFGDELHDEALGRIARDHGWTGLAAFQNAGASTKVEAPFLHTAAVADEALGAQDGGENLARRHGPG